MTDRHLSERFERGTRERKLLRSFEMGFIDDYLKNVALLDLDTRQDMVFYCARHEVCEWTIWCMAEDPDAWEDEIFCYTTYEEARKAFDKLAERELQPNWEAQSEYDELHGTVNGEDPGIVAMRELWGE